MSSTALLVDESRVPQILTGIIIPTVLSSIFVLARLYTRLSITRNWGTDDSFIGIAWIASIGLAVTDGLFTRYGSGHHQIFAPLSGIVPTFKLAFAARLIYQFVLCLTKIGICVFYLRVFQDRRSKMWVYLITTFVAISAIILEFVFIFSCNPVSNAWDGTGVGCVSSTPSTVANAVCNILADVFLMIFVIPRVIPLQMARRQKISLLVVVSLGIVVIASAIARVYLVTSLAGNTDMTWNGYTITTWTTLEVSIGLFCASAPCIRPLLRQIAPGLMSSISQTMSGPSHAKPSRYGNGTGASLGTKRKDRAEAYILTSRSRGEGDEQFVSAGGVNNTFWVGKGGGADSSDEERGSMGDIVTRGGTGVGDIMKTISVEVTDDDRSVSGLSEGSRKGERDGGIEKFEHV